MVLRENSGDEQRVPPPRVFSKILLDTLRKETIGKALGKGSSKNDMSNGTRCSYRAGNSFCIQQPDWKCKINDVFHRFFFFLEGSFIIRGESLALD